MIETILQFLVAILQRYQNRESLKVFGAARSSQWRKTRAEHLRKNPACAVCGEKGTLLNSNNVHHIKVFHKYPELENDSNNILTLCREHHFWFGHLGSFASWNESVREDAELWRQKILKRP